MNLHDRVKKTYAYGQIFGYKRSFPEIYFWLLGSKKIPYTLFKTKIGSKINTYGFKKKINVYSKEKTNKAVNFLSPIFKLPFIYFVGLTGSVSANNAKKSDDIDIFIITAPHTMWVARPVILLYLEIIKRRRRRFTPLSDQMDLICPNLWMDSLNLKLPKSMRNLYVAHEILQVLPIYNKMDTYQRFLQSNSWVKKYLANAYSQTANNKKLKTTSSFQGILFGPLNLLLFFLQIIFMWPLTKGENVNYTQAYFHDQKFSKNILSKV